MVTNPNYEAPNGAVGLDYGDYERLGGLALRQLAELRHRGAFTTVSQTFAAYCQKCASSADKKIASLRPAWYQVRISPVDHISSSQSVEDTMLCIQQKASALTRRSAGLPAMIAGILSADSKGDFFEIGMLDLQVIAKAPITSVETRNEPRLPQVHALNCLKVLFTDTRLGSATEPYVESTLIIATKCIEQDMSLNSPLLI